MPMEPRSARGDTWLLPTTPVEPFHSSWTTTGRPRSAEPYGPNGRPPRLTQPGPPAWHGWTLRSPSHGFADGSVTSSFPSDWHAERHASAPSAYAPRTG